MARPSMLSTAAGMVVAGALVYTVHASMRDQTQFMVSTMHAEAQGLAHADEYDKASGQRRATALKSAYTPGFPSFWEEIKARWNSFDLADRVPRSPSHGTGPAAPDTYSVRDALASLAPHAPDARPRVGILHRTYGDANTHYLGQGASLR